MDNVTRWKDTVPGVTSVICLKIFHEESSLAAQLDGKRFLNEWVFKTKKKSIQVLRDVTNTGAENRWQRVKVRDSKKFRSW